MSGFDREIRRHGGEEKEDLSRFETVPSTKVDDFGRIDIENLKMIGDRILVQRVDVVNKIGSILLPDNAKEERTEGVVIKVGKGRYTESGMLIPMEIEVGKRVLFGAYSGHEVSINGEKYIVVRQDEIIFEFEQLEEEE